MILKQEKTKLYIKCDQCGKEWTTSIYNYKNRKHKKCDLCKSCGQKGRNNPFYGKQHSTKTKEKISKVQRESGWANGKNNPFYGKQHSTETKEKISKVLQESNSKLTKQEKINKYDSGWWKKIKGKTNEEYYGLKKSNEMHINQINNQRTYWHYKNDDELSIIKNKISNTQQQSKKSAGENNPMSLESIAKRNNCSLEEAKRFTPMYGVNMSDETKNKLSQTRLGHPAPEGSGNGISGWILNPRIYFRSSYELSYFIYLIENNINFVSAEKQAYKMPYMLNGKQRYHFSDIIIENKTMIEIKPEARLNESINVLKSDVAKEWCKKHNLEYKTITEKDINYIFSAKDILQMDGSMIKLSQRWREKLYEQTK